MRRLSRSTLALLTCTAAMGVAAAAAAAGGGPSPGILAGGDGVRAPDDMIRYVTIPGRGATALAAVRVRDGRVVRFATLRGLLGIPLVAFDGTTGGLSHDRRTLVLSTYAPQAAAGTSTHFAVVRTRSLRVERRIDLPGVWSFDAVSPDGSTILAIRYLSPTEPDRYEVRAIDAATGRVLTGTIVDKREPDEEMRGQPVSRAADATGRWAFTLYAKPNGAGFIHALDTVRGAAVCIDLPWKGVSEALWAVRLSVDGKTLGVRQPGVGLLALVDLTTFVPRVLRSPVAP